MLLLFWALPWDCNAIDRCPKYRAQVIREARYHIGMEAPAYLFMGQIEQESRCDEGITAFDGGAGLGQFMPATAEWIQEREKALQEISIEPLPYDPRWAIRALILYDKWLYSVVVCKGWYFALRAYNGGAGQLNKEIRTAQSCEIFIVEGVCKRKIIRFKNGKYLDLCRDVNIPYYYLICKKGEKYK